MTQQTARATAARVQSILLCAAIATILAMADPAKALINETWPEWNLRRLLVELLLSGVLAGISLAALTPTRWTLGFLVVGASCAFSVLGFVALFAWCAFVSRDDHFRALPFDFGFFRPLWTDVEVVHTGAPLFGPKTWGMLTLGAIVAGVLIAVAFMQGALRKDNVRTVLMRLLTYVATPTAIFSFGSILAERRIWSAQDYDIAGWSLPCSLVVLLGTLMAWAVRAPLHRPELGSSANRDSEKLDLDKMLATASQLSVLVLVLLGLGLSQTASYGDALAEIAAARRALAVDLMTQRHAAVAAAIATRQGVATQQPSVYGSLPNVLWADATIKAAKIPDGANLGPGRAPTSAERDILLISETATHERWAFPALDRGGPVFPATSAVADRLGVKYTEKDTAEKLYPQIDAQLRTREVAFPGIGLSLSLKSFVFLIPLVVGATLVLLAYRLDGLVERHDQLTEPWILIESAKGLAAVLNRLWLACIAIGPGVQGIYSIEVLALTNKSRGLAQTALSDVYSTAYAILALALVLAPAKSCLDSLLRLRYRKLDALEAGPLAI